MNLNALPNHAHIKRIIIYITIILILIFQLTVFTSGKDSTASATSDRFSNKFIAHAMGGIDGATYTNSLEAFIENYKKGYHTFEVDLILTTDNQLVACHDWDLINDGQPMSSSEFMKSKIFNKYTPLDINAIAKLMQKYQDIYIITDTKSTDKNITETTFQSIYESLSNIDTSILNRIIPQIYNQDMYDWIMNIYNFQDLIYTLYQSNDTDEQVLEFVSKNNITKVTMSESRFNINLNDKLINANILTYVHTINTVNSVNSYTRKGVYGFYTDNLTPQSYNEHSRPSDKLMTFMQFNKVVS